MNMITKASRYFRKAANIPNGEVDEEGLSKFHSWDWGYQANFPLSVIFMIFQNF